MILCIDVGLKNLAMCVMNFSDHKDISSYKIHLWDVYNILDEEKKLCKAFTKSNNICNKKCLYKFDETFTCKKHFPKGEKITSKNKVKIKKISNCLLQDIVSLFLKKFNYIFNDNIEIFNHVSEIYIELQPKINPKMKMISHILFGKLIELYTNSNNINQCKIRFISAVKKLKAYTGPYIECKLKSKYSQRKWLGIQYTKWFLENKFNKEQYNIWYSLLDQNNKLDDLCDTFLMCIHCISTKK